MKLSRKQRQPVGPKIPSRFIFVTNEKRKIETFVTDPNRRCFSRELFYRSAL
jgi:hypothetical protein